MLRHGGLYENTSLWKLCLILCVKSQQFIGSGRLCAETEHLNFVFRKHSEYFCVDCLSHLSRLGKEDLYKRLGKMASNQLRNDMHLFSR